MITIKATKAMGKAIICTLEDGKLKNYPSNVWFSGGNKNSNGSTSRDEENTYIFPSSGKVFVGWKPYGKCHIFSNIPLSRSSSGGYLTGNQLVEAILDSYDGINVKICDPTGKNPDLRSVKVSNYNWLTIITYMDIDTVKQMYRDMFKSLIEPNYNPPYSDWNCDYFMKKLKWTSVIGCENNPFDQIMETIKFPEFEHDYDNLRKIIINPKNDNPIF